MPEKMVQRESFVLKLHARKAESDNIYFVAAAVDQTFRQLMRLLGS